MLNELKKLLEFNNKIIVCDVQPMYEKYIHFNIQEFCQYLNTKEEILYYYVGQEDSGIGDDTKEEVLYWLIENGLNEDKAYDITFIDKGYAFLRGWMDNGVSDEAILNVLRYMIENDISDSRDFEDPSIIDEIAGEEVSELADNIYLPNFEMPEPSQFSGAELIGGGRNECLKELELALMAYGINYALNNRYIYG